MAQKLRKHGKKLEKTSVGCDIDFTILLSMLKVNVFTNSIFRDCKIIRDPQSLKSKGYGFVSFVNKVVSII